MVKRLYIKEGHFAHENLAKTICQKEFKPDKRWKKIFVPWRYDTYFIEGSLFPVITLWIYRNILRKKIKIINIFSDPRLYSLNSKTYFNEKKGKRVKYQKIKMLFVKKLINIIDGHVFIGKYQKELFDTINGIKKDKPFIIAYPCIKNKRFKELGKINPDLKSKNIVFIGGVELATELEYKGYDVLFDVFSDLKKDDNEINLTIIGGGWDEKNKIKEARFTGALEDISSELEKSSLFVHLGLGDAFCITVIEAMRAGLPVIISNQVGAKELVERARKSFIVDRKNKENIKKQIKNYFNLSLTEKKKLSSKFRKESEFFNEENCAEDFKKKFLKMEQNIR